MASLQCSVIRHIDTTHFCISDILAVGEYTVIYIGDIDEQKDHFCLNKLCMGSGRILCGIRVTGRHSITPVTLDGVECIAVAWRTKKMPPQKYIEFRFLSNLEAILDRPMLAGSGPILCHPNDPDVLVHVKENEPDQVINVIKWQDSTQKPTDPVKAMVVACSRKLEDMCLVEQAGRKFVIVTSLVDDGGCGGVEAYDEESGHLVWHAQGIQSGMDKPLLATGLTSDEDGQIFICDSNNDCIHCLSPLDGKHLGTVRMEQLGTPIKIRWFKGETFHVSNRKIGHFYMTISFVEIKQELKVSKD